MPDPPITFGSAASTSPLPGQMALDLPAAGERNSYPAAPVSEAGVTVRRATITADWPDAGK